MKSVLIIFFFFFFTFFQQYRGQNLICDYCKEVISSGKYLKIDDKFFHSNHFICSGCGKQILENNFFSDSGMYYHKSCYYEKMNMKCAHCGKFLTGTYITKDDKKYHEACFYNSVAKRCDLCGGIISGSYIKDYWGNNYHSEHKDDSKCEFCDRYISEKITGGGKRYSDGNIICNLCYKNSVQETAKAKRILNEINSKLKKHLIFIDISELPIELVNQNELNKLSDHKDFLSKPRGFSVNKTRILNGLVKDKKLSIKILRGMEITNFYLTVAHELMHIWQYQNRKKEADLAFNEGSCNYAAYLILKDIKNEMSEKLIQDLNNNPNEFYGEGFRRVKNLVDKKGFDYWLERLKNYGDFPSGY